MTRVKRGKRLGRVSTLGAAALLVVLLLGGCTKSGGDDLSATPAPLPEDMPACGDLFAEGKTVERAAFGQACKSEGGDLAVPRPVSLNCTDDRVLLWNEYAWGYVDETMTLIQPGVNDKEPIDEAMTCLERRSGAAGGAPATTAPPAAEG